jgi:hypothetical protein
MKYSKGICWLDDTRIPFVDSDKETINFDRPRIREKKDWVYDLGTTWENPDVKEYNTQGRFTPNLLVCDDMLNDGNIYKSGDGKSGMKLINHNVNNFAVGEDCSFHKESKTIHYGDKGTNSRYYDLDKWFDKVIDEIQ